MSDIHDYENIEPMHAEEFFPDIGVKSNERVAVFIDGSNLYSAVKQLNMQLDYSKLFNIFNQYNLIRMSYYTAILEEDNTPLRTLVDYLQYNNYNVITKRAKRITTSTGSNFVKGNIDVDMAVDMMELRGYVDHIFLFSGDGDFEKLLVAMQRVGVKVTVISTLAINVCADNLRRQADVFIDLTNIRSYIERDDVRNNEVKEDEDKSYTDFQHDNVPGRM